MPGGGKEQVKRLISGLKEYKDGVTKYLEEHGKQGWWFDKKHEALAELLKSNEMRGIMAGLGKPVAFKFKKNSIRKLRPPPGEINQYVLKIRQMREVIEREAEMRLDNKYYEAQEKHGEEIRGMLNGINGLNGNDVISEDMPAKLIHALHLQYWDLKNKTRIEENGWNRRRRF
ncbi:hypothetical protein HY993_02115 [Candidatus Micrarchaeota archaeon]|nr:hypothetical protein [Candidatus Micrarchaeota archaeon]